MSASDSTNRSGKNNPFVQILSPDFLINAEGHEVKRTKAQPTRPAIIRFLEKIEVSETRFFDGSPCWEWQGTKSNGYGQFRFDGRRGSSLSSPHRFSYAYFIGTIPEGYEVDHKCRNRGCSNPLHLESVTVQVNRKRRDEALTSCRAGHPFNETDTLIKNGKRRCRICNREKVKAFYARNPGYEKRMNFKSRQKT